MTTRFGRLRLLLILIGLSLPIAAGTLAGQSGGARPAGNPAQVWTGTVTVEQRGSGKMMPSGEGARVTFTGQERTTFSLHGDGTASWSSSASNTVDMAGLYTIPTRGAGSGIGTGSVTFNGTDWDISVDAEDEFPVSTDYTAQDEVWAEKGVVALLIEMEKAMGRPVGPIGPHVEDGMRNPAGASVSARGAASATSLNGSATFQVESIHIGGFNGVPATMTVTWALTKGPVTPSVRIYGPECGCMTKDETEKSLHFIAGATPEGGEFSEFVVTSNGKMPEIVTNNGGDHPSLDIVGTKDTGEVTLKITYTQNGVRRDSAPFVVNFCAIEKLEFADDEHDLSFDDAYRLTVDVKAKAWRGGKEISDELSWDLERMGAPTTIVGEPSTKKGEHVKLIYRLLPEKNSDFGVKTVSATTSGTCACRRDDTIRAFFMPEAHTHPGGQTPNWFYYWTQTAGAPENMRSIIKYRESVEDPRMPGQSAALYDYESATLFLSDLVAKQNGCRARRSERLLLPTGEHAQGIDCFAEDIKHELQHRQDAITWWGSPRGIASVSVPEWLARDWDADQVPNEIEDARRGCNKGSFVPGFGLASRDSWFTCAERPFTSASDAEINAYWEGWKWPIGSINKQDWSCGDLGKQWRGRKCGG